MQLDKRKFLRELTALPGLPGHEREAGEAIARWLRPFSDEVSVDKFGNVVGRVGRVSGCGCGMCGGGAGPKIMVSAHMDEIGLVVSYIEEDGALRLARSGGVDPRILPAAEVIVHTRGGQLPGVVGAKAPHLLTAEERKKAIELDAVFVDIGYPADEVKRRVRVGDRVTLVGPLTELANGRLAAKTMDDRAGVCCMLVAMEQLQKMRVNAEVHFVASCQEEVGCFGARTAAYAIAPDVGIAIDVTHGAGPGTGPFEAFELDKVAIGAGPSLSKPLLKLLREVAGKHHIDTALDISDGSTWTDADAIIIEAGGVPCALVSIPLKYMHTTVETLSEAAIEEAGRLIALFIAELADRWEGFEWH